MSTPSGKSQSKILKVLIGVLVAIVVFVVIVVAIGSSTGDDSETTTAAEEAATESVTEVSEESTEEAEASLATEETGVAGDDDQVMPWTRHERCEPDDGTAATLTGVLNDKSLTVDNAQLIKDGEDTWIGTSLLDADGDLESRSDVWLLQDGALFSVSGGAKNESWALEHPDVAYNMTNEFAQGVDRCVVAETMGR